MATTVVGLFSSRDAANNAVTDLVNQGFDKGDITVFTAGNNTTTTDSTITGTKESGWDKFLESIHLRAPEQDHGYYAGGVQSGQISLSLICADDDADDAAATMQNNGAVDIDEQMSNYRTGSTAGDMGMGAGSYVAPVAAVGVGATTTAKTDTTANYTGGTANEGAVIPIIEEQLEVGKRTVQSGGVRVYKHVTETAVSEQISLHKERVSIDRRPVNRAVAAGDNAFQEGSMEVTETDEVPVVAKTARVVEEVVVGKTGTDRTETVSDTVRRTDVDVEQIAGDTVATGTSANKTTILGEGG